MTTTLKPGDRAMVYMKTIEGREHAVSCETAATTREFGTVTKRLGMRSKTTARYELKMDNKPSVTTTVPAYCVFPAPLSPEPSSEVQRLVKGRYDNSVFEVVKDAVYPLIRTYWRNGEGWALVVAPDGRHISIPDVMLDGCYDDEQEQN